MECWARLAASRYHRLAGETATALSWARDAVATARRKGSPYLELSGHIACAQAALANRDDPAWQAAMEAALPIAERHGCRLELAQLSLLRAVWSYREGHEDAERAWLEAACRIERDNYAFILERERVLAFPLLAAHARSRNPEVRKSADSLFAQLARIAPLPLRVTCLGRFEVWQGSRRIHEREWSKRHAGELFRLLLLQPNRTATDEFVFEALCPEQTPEAARTLLHHATSTLRRILEPDLPEKFPSRYVRFENHQIMLNLPPGSSVDIEEFELGLKVPAFGPAAEPGAPGLLESTLGLYGGELLPGDRSADWSVAARARLSELHQRAQLELARRRLTRGEPQAALDLCRKIAATDPWNEAAVLLGMQACVALDDRPGALGLYKNLEHALRVDLQISPRKDVEALAVSLRDA
jgi:DNA-binding SARP family transcriptional activator